MTRQTIAQRLLLLGLALATGCKANKPAGQLVLSIQTDMSLPQQIDTIRVQVLVHGQRLLDQDYPVGSADATLIPATLTIVAGKEAGLPVTIRVLGGKHNGTWRTFREVVTTVPQDRTASIRMPIQWLCDGTAQVSMQMGADGLPVQTFQSTCGDGNACVAGRCVPSQVPEAMLPTYDPRIVFGGAADPAQGTCFDTVPCMMLGAVAEPADDCTVPKPVGPAGVNVALRVAGDGICDASGGTCFVPLDANSSEGWSLQGDRLALPRAACDKLKRGTISAVYVSTACASKTESIPPCGPWSSVHGSTAGPSATDAGAPSTATRLASLGSDTGDSLPCCPLMSDGHQLYTCVCTKSAARLVSFDPAQHQLKSVMDLPVPAARTNPYFAAALRDGTIFWVDAVANTIERATLSDGKRAPSVQVNGEITEATPLLVDDTSLYVQASAVVGAMGAPVQLLKIDRAAGTVRAFDTGSNFHVHQFAQDDAAIYLVSDADTGGDAGGAVARTSRVVRIAKADGALSDASPALTITTPDRYLGGYTSVHTDGAGGAALYSLYQGALTPAGTLVAQVLKIDPGTRASQPLLERSIDPAATGLWVLGALDGAVLLARTENTASDAGAGIRSSSVIVLPADGSAPRIVGDFARDYPVLGLPAFAFDADSVYWLNSGGDLYRLPRGALR